VVAEAGTHDHEAHDHGEQESGGHEHEHGTAGHDHAAAGGIEWEDDMVAVNRMTTPANMRWKIVDRETGAENAAIDWQFRVGDQVKIRLLNEMAGDHPMHHPFHVHGAGRFLVLARDDVAEPNLVWKTRFWCAPARPSTSCSTSPTSVCGWRTATSPSTTRAG
jgi:FtsP/CotA-like multicopper oxidase with cupredoxin domain